MFFTFRAALFASLAEQAGEPAHGRFGRIGQSRLDLLDARRAVPLGPAAMETLTVIAYNQPVSRAFIAQVRGVDSSSSVSGLLEKGLIEEAGRLDLPGRPVSFRTTDTFLRVFGLSSLADLPPVHGPQTPEQSGAAPQEGEG